MTALVRRGACLASMLAACLLPPAAGAQEPAERLLLVPVKVTDAYGKQIERDITVTVFEVPGRASYPLLVLSHGRPVDAAGRVRMGRVRYSEASRWFASLGYSVWVPTRIGYGVSGTEDDPEYTGTCQSKRYEPGYAVAAEQTLQVIEHAKRNAAIDARRVVAVGQSFGGTTSVAVAARNPAGLVAAINFAGGGGGNPATHPGTPCAPDSLRELFEGYGTSSRVPTLWVYTENDKWMGPRYTREWFEAFRARGGAGDFVMHPAFGEDGHALFTRGLALWRPIVERFLAKVGESVRE
jgi:dienelactone hydrolase